MYRERVRTQSFVGLSIGNSKSNHLGAQGTLVSEQSEFTHSGSLVAAGWPLHNIVMANIVWCTAYKRGGAYCAIAVQ